MATTDEIENWFTYHPPKGDQVMVYEDMRNRARELAHFINQHCPEGAEKEAALLSLRKTVMWANAGIACGGDS